MDSQRMTLEVHLRAVLAVLALFIFLVTAVAQPALAAPLYLLRLGPQGNLPAESVAACVEAIASGRASPPRHVVVLIHGYDTGAALARERYEHFAECLSRCGARDIALVGVCWPSRPGPDSTWVMQAAVHQAAAEVGLGDRVVDPYGRTAWRAQRVGRQAVRQLVFGIQDAFPGAAVHLVAHSMGAKSAVAALAPELLAEGGDRAPAAAPAREMKVESVVLAGADLDADLFVSGPGARAASAALPRARLWWFTVADRDRKDRALQWRKIHVGEGAIGNAGPQFSAPDTDRLLRERRLVIDMGRVPPSHDYNRYFCAERVAAIVAAIDRIEPWRAAPAEAVAGFRQTLAATPAPAAEDPTTDLLSRLDQVLAAAPTTASLQPYLRDPAMSVRLYAAWRLEAGRTEARPAFPDGFTVGRALAAIARARGVVP
jgi:esterase/lipase superfamily enzyme